MNFKQRDKDGSILRKQ